MYIDKETYIVMQNVLGDIAKGKAVYPHEWKVLFDWSVKNHETYFPKTV